ncbi:wax ester/triacylglycerol synthase domain-containing protein [Pseudonocardia saturnea]
MMSLAAERGSTPMQVGAVLTVEAGAGLDPELVVQAIAHRITAVPRLRQRLMTVPWGCGRPVWVDDRHFAVGNHFSVLPCPPPGGERAVLEIAADMLGARLPRDRPLWAATWVLDTGQGSSALIVVLHHVLADGIGGLAVLAGLVDDGADSPDSAFPRPMPSRRRLAVDAMLDHLRGAARLPVALRRLRGGASQLRPVISRRLARTSLNRPTGPHRRFTCVRVDLDEVHRAAHRHGATVNDVVLSAIAAALHRLLARRGEHVDDIVISVPFSTRRHTTAHELGNRSGVIPLRVPGTGGPARRLTSLAATTRAARTARRGASTALLSPLFRVLAAAGLYRWFIDRQRRIHTFVSNLRGPESRLVFAGCPITDIVALSSAMGNVTVAFAVLSYAGRLTITLVADPDTCPDVSALRDLVEEELRVLTGADESPRENT